METITSTELYAIDASPVFVGQTACDEDTGDYQMEWKTSDGTHYLVNMNLFNW